LPTEQAAEMLALWQEFEAAATADARFAKSVDRLQPTAEPRGRRRHLDRL
jgi:putative hydrolase of HD superfamily